MSASAKNLLVKLYYDSISPYSWIALEALTRYQKVWPMDIELRPVFLGGMLNASGNTTPLVIDAKAKYVAEDLKSLARYWDVPLNVPENFAQTVLQNPTIHAQRFLTAVFQKEPSKLNDATRLLFKRFWTERKSTDKKEDLLEVAETASIVKELVDNAFDDSMKEPLKAMTNEALKLGAFGVPWINVQDTTSGKSRSFFGSDRFQLMAHVFGLSFHGPHPV